MFGKVVGYRVGVIAPFPVVRGKGFMEWGPISSVYAKTTEGIERKARNLKKKYGPAFQYELADCIDGFLPHWGNHRKI